MASRTLFRPLPVLLVLLVLLAPSTALAQAEETLCDFRSIGRISGMEEAGVPVVILRDPFTVECPDGAELRADSGRLNRSINELHLVGNVFFQDSLRTLTSQEATYNSRTARLWATGNVEFTDRTDGSTIRGPELEYFRATDERPVAQMTATRRPTVTVPARPTDDDGEPLQIVADRVVTLGSNDLSAIGGVVITRPDLRATGAEASYDSAAETLELMQNARIVSDEYELTGEVIHVRLAEGALEYLQARTAATLRGEDLEVTAPELHLFFADDALQRAVARADEGQRAQAISETFRIRADSLDANLVDQRLNQVFAVGRAFAETLDAVDPPVASAESPDAGEAAVVVAVSRPAPSPVLASDWIRGDTIIAFFEPPAEAVLVVEAGAAEAEPVDADDTREAPTRSAELRRLQARGSAHSLYRFAGENDRPGERSNVNFLVGEQIELDLVDGELQVAHVLGLQQGVYLEATPGNGAPAIEPAPAGDPAPEPELESDGEALPDSGPEAVPQPPPVAGSQADARLPAESMQSEPRTRGTV